MCTKHWQKKNNKEKWKQDVRCDPAFLWYKSNILTLVRSRKVKASDIFEGFSLSPGRDRRTEKIRKSHTESRAARESSMISSHYDTTETRMFEKKMLALPPSQKL